MSDNRGCLGFLAGLFGKRSQEAEVPKAAYRLRDDFLSAAELSYYRVLSTAVAGRAVVLAKVGLADLFFVPRGEGSTGAWNRIARKHVDFVVCAPETMRPLVGVELDDRSHERADRVERDGFVDEVFRSAGLPLMHVPVRSGYSVAELQAALAPYLGGGEAERGDAGVEAVRRGPGVAEGERSANPVAGDGVAPSCPKCGVPMVLRTAGRGERRGEQFYGCPNYPRCRERAAVGGG